MPPTLTDGGRPRRNRAQQPAAAPVSVHRQSTTPSPVLPGCFEALGVPAPLAAALRETGIAAPFPIQTATLPDALAGRDVLGQAQTGSGKTIAFAIPLATTLSSDYRRTPGRPAALVLVPTRELAAQVARTVAPLVRVMGLRCATIHGGVPQGPQVSALRRGADVIVATPGRLEDLIAQGHCRLDRVRITVLDEADHMADLGFLPAVRRILDQTPSGGQRLLFSATLDATITGLASRYMHRPAVHTIDRPDTSPAEMDHHLFTVQRADKTEIVTELASGEGRSLLFTRTKHSARKLARQLTTAGIPAVDLHSDLAQSARQRNLAAFTEGTVRVLVATDIAARGVHVDDIALVVHVDPPAEHKTYLHRSGRTARAGARGAVVTIAAPDQTRDVIALMRKANIRAANTAVRPGDRKATSLAGPPAQRRQPSATVRADAPVRRDRPVRRPGDAVNPRAGAQSRRTWRPKHRGGAPK